MSILDIEIWKTICLLLVFIESQSLYLVGYNLIDNMGKDNNSENNTLLSFNVNLWHPISVFLNF